MYDKQAMVVEITFAPPPRADSSEEPREHRRILDRVPPDTAEQMVRDFTAFHEDPAQARQRKLYTYQQMNTTAAKGEMMIGLDFGEIVALEARPDE